MTTKKPAQLGENLLQIRPRKGEAKPQTESEAFNAEAESLKPSQPNDRQKKPPRRRRRISEKKQQLNLKIDEDTLNRFLNLADKEGMLFGALFKKMLDKYEDK